MPTSRVLTLRQVLAARPWLTERRLRHLVQTRQVPYSKVSGHLLFDLADIDQLVERNRVEAS